MQHGGIRRLSLLYDGLRCLIASSKEYPPHFPAVGVHLFVCLFGEQYFKHQGIIKAYMIDYICNPITWEVETGGIRIQRYP